MTVGFLDHREGQCRFPIGDPLEPSFQLCGLPAPRGKSYCPACHALAYEPARPAYAPRDPMVLRQAKPSDDPVELTGVLR